MLTSPSGKSYIGQTVKTLQERIATHCSSNGCPALFAAISKYGIDNFNKEVLLVVNDDLLDEYEIKLIEAYGTRVPRGYNIAPGGGVLRGEDNPMFGRVGPLNPRYGTTLTTETKQKLRAAWQKNPRGGIFHPMFGKQHSDATKTKISQARIGKYGGEKNPFWGKRGPDHPSTGRCRTESQKAALRQPKSAEWKAKMRDITSKRVKDGLFNKCKVGKYDYRSGELLAVFESQSAAAKTMGCAAAQISDVVRGKKLTCKGFVWKAL